MGKRTQSVSEYLQNKYLRNKGDYDFEDYISELPDEVLVNILSRVTVKDAAVTSALSKRWRFLWTSNTSLNFDATKKLDKIAVKPELCETARRRYVNWVNYVLRQYRGPAIDEFRVCFDLDVTSSCAIDRWIMFAMAKRVQRLELDLLDHGKFNRIPLKNYSLPYELLLGHSRRSSLKQSFSYGTIIQPCVAFKSLKDLSLKSINVTDKFLECFLSNCSFLELLSVHGSGCLVNLRVSGSSLLLKHLEIVDCVGIKSIVICDTNLVSFKYLGVEISLLLENVPLLVEVSIGEGASGLVNFLLRKLACCLSQLEILTLDITFSLEEIIKPRLFPELTKLKQLVLKVGACKDDSLLGFTSLLKACPYLQIFVLKLMWSNPSRRRTKVIRKAVNCPHQNLKVVELAGYYGRTSDVELAMYFIENAVQLKKIVINPRNQYVGRCCPLGIDENMEEQSARRCAKEQLLGKVPRTIKLVIL